METTYEVLCEMEEKGILSVASKKGIIPITAAFHKLVYETFKSEKTRLEKAGIKPAYTRSVFEASIRYDISERWVKKIIKSMES